MSQRIKKKLAKLQAQLTKASNSELWDEVLRSDDFIQLERLESEMIALELPGFLEQISFQRKLREWRFVHRHLSDGIDQINKLYIVTEDFEEVQKLIASLRLRPRLSRQMTGSQTVRPNYHKSNKKIICRSLKSWERN